MSLAIRGRVHLVGLVLVGSVCLHLALSTSSSHQPVMEGSLLASLASDEAPAHPMPEPPAGHPEGHGAVHLASLHLAVVVAIAVLLLVRVLASGPGTPLAPGGFDRRAAPGLAARSGAEVDRSPVTTGVLLRV